MRDVRNRVDIRRQIDRELRAKEGDSTREHFKLAKALESALADRDRMRGKLRELEARYAVATQAFPSAVRVPRNEADVTDLGLRINRQVLENLMQQADRL